MALKHSISSKGALRALRKLAIDPLSFLSSTPRFSSFTQLRRLNDVGKPSLEEVRPPGRQSTSQNNTVKGEETVAWTAFNHLPAWLEPVETITVNIQAKENARLEVVKYEGSVQEIEAALQRQDSKLAAHIILSLCLRLADTGLASDWTRLHDLLVCYMRKIHDGFMLPIRQELIETLLGRPLPILKAVELLYIWDDRATKRRSQGSAVAGSGDTRGNIRPSSVVIYLQTFCHHHRDISTQFEETSKVFRGLSLISRPLDLDLMLPLLRSARNSSDAELVYNMFTATCEEFDLQPTTKTLHALLQCFATTTPGRGDWGRVHELITLSHDLGYSRRKASKHALLVLTAVVRYAQTASPPRVHDFLTYHLQETGLLPTKELCRWVFLYYFKADRFDLAQKWSHILHSCFAGASHPITNDPIFFYDLAYFWERKAASCVEILKTCKILTHGAVRDPFSDDSKLFIRGAVLAHLRNRAKHAGMSFVPGRTLEDLIDVKYLLDHFQHQLSHGDLHPWKWHVQNESLVRQELWQQLKAAKDTILMLEDYRKFLDANLWITNVPITPAPPATMHVRKNLEKKIFGPASRRWLEGSIEERLQVFKPSSSEETDQDLPRRMAEEMIVCLASEDRFSDLSLILQQLSKLPHATEILTPNMTLEWMTAAFRSHRLSAFRDAIWWLVESPSDTKVSLKTMLFMCSAVEKCERKASEGRITLGLVGELHYLRRRLFRRWWLERRSPDLSSFPNARVAKLYKDLSEVDSQAPKWTKDLVAVTELPYFHDKVFAHT